MRTTSLDFLRKEENTVQLHLTLPGSAIVGSHKAAFALQEANSSSTCPSKTVPLRTDATSSAFSMLSRMTAPPALRVCDVFTLHGSRRRNRKRSLAIS